MSYQELVNVCKKAYADKDMNLAYKFWCDIHDILDKKLDEFDKYDEENRFKCYKEFQDYMKQFTDDEVYRITDYSKQKAYRQMEIEKTYNILDKSIKCSELYKSSKKMKYLDDFISFYEWCILESDDIKGLYNIYDLQTNRIIDDDENNGNKTKVETILRLVDRALDYELDEVEYDTDEDYENALNSRYIKGLISIQDEFIEKRTKELEKEIEYEERKLEYCAYGKSDLYHIEHLKWKLEQLGDR